MLARGSECDLLRKHDLHCAQGLPPGEVASSLGSRDQSSVSEQCVSPLNQTPPSAIVAAQQSLRYRSNSTSARHSRSSTDEQEVLEDHRCAHLKRVHLH